MGKVKRNYTVYHCHTQLSLLDSVTDFHEYVDKAVEQGQTSIGFSEHGNLFMWVAKQEYCEEKGLKYLHGIECYMTEALYRTDEETGKRTKVRDNFHTVLIAKNHAGLLELNALISKSTDKDHHYYKPRISFDEFFALSKNVIKISACIAGPLCVLDDSHPLYERLVKAYDYLEVQGHNHPVQIAYNRRLVALHKKYGIPLIAGTDTHSIDAYAAECRTILQLSKGIDFSLEDGEGFDLTWKSYDQLVEMFKIQGVLTEDEYLEAIENTNVMAASVEPTILDKRFKYPKLYGDRDEQVFLKNIDTCFKKKIDSDIISIDQISAFKEALAEEHRVFKKIEMMGFMLFMSEMITWCKQNGIPVGPGRGSCCGSRTAYVTNITDVDPERWHTVFSRFANEDRKELGDIDVDIAPEDRDRVYEYIINRFTPEKTAFILALGTLQDKGCIDTICKAFRFKWEKTPLTEQEAPYRVLSEIEHADCNKSKKTARAILTPTAIAYLEKYGLIQKPISEISQLMKDRIELVGPCPKSAVLECPYPLQSVKEIKSLYDKDPGAAKKKFPKVFYYLDGMLNVTVSQSMHPAGIVASPITLRDNYGTFINEGHEILYIDMDCVHDVGLVKYDILGLKNVGIIKEAADLSGVPYPESHKVNFDDARVWEDMVRSPVGIFEFEGAFAFDCLKKFKTRSIFDMALVTACIRPSGASYRNDLLARKVHHNPSKIIDDLLKDNLGYLCIEGNQKVSTKRGEIPIREVAVGDYVQTRCGWRRVLDSRYTGYKELKRISYCGGHLTATPDHKVLTKNGWKRTNQLESEFVFCMKDGERKWVPVLNVSDEEPADVYDITVEDVHEFVCQGIVVHNCFQEDTIKFLQLVCGLSGSEADNIRRGIGHKDKERLVAAMPEILEGYCSKSDKIREVAEQEAKEFLQIIEDSASYQFG